MKSEEEYTNRISEFRNQLFKLLSTPALTIRDILKEKPPRFNVEGVYIISTPNDREHVYVGKTKTNTVVGRVADHRHKDTKSDLKGMLLKLFSDYPQKIDDYLVRCVEVADARKRTFFEQFSISVLQPHFNK